VPLRGGRKGGIGEERRGKRKEAKKRNGRDGENTPAK